MGANDRKDANNRFEYRADEGQSNHYDTAHADRSDEHEATSISSMVGGVSAPEVASGKGQFAQPTDVNAEQTKVMDAPMVMDWFASEGASGGEHDAVCDAVADAGLDGGLEPVPLSEQTALLDVSVPLSGFETAPSDAMSLLDDAQGDALPHDTDKPVAQHDAELQPMMPDSRLFANDSGTAGIADDFAAFDNEPLVPIPDAIVLSERTTVSSAAASVRVNDAEFTQLLTQVRDRPERFQLWDRLEQVATKLDAAPVVAQAYRQALQNDFDQQLAADLIERAVTYHDEWLDDPLPTFELLERVLEIDPSAR